MARYTDWKGEHKQKCKRGFATRKEALEWEREFLQQKQADVEMPFDSFVELYTKDIKPRLKENTWLTKENIIQNKILPYFGKRKLCEITAKDVIDWQNEIRSTKDATALGIINRNNRRDETSPEYHQWRQKRKRGEWQPEEHQEFWPSPCVGTP